MKSYKEIYREIFPKINIEKVLNSYKIDFKTYLGNKGKEYLFCCPFPNHDDLSPSFSLNSKTGVYHCFVCGAGDFFKFIKKIEKFDSINQAIDLLKKKLGIHDEEQHMTFEMIDKSFANFCENKKQEVTEKIVPELKEISLPQCESAENYFDIVKKRVDLETIKKWNLKYCLDPINKYEEKYSDRLIIPIYFENKLVTFAARDMSGKSEKWNEVKKEIKAGKYSIEEQKELRQKYECKKILYPFSAPISYIYFNWDEAIKNRKYVILVEGVFDAMKLAEYGYNVMAILSTHINDYRVNLLIKHFDVIYLALDNDDKTNADGTKINPGQEAAQKLMEEKLDDLEVYNIVLPFGKDPDECSNAEFEKYFVESKKNFCLLS